MTLREKNTPRRSLPSPQELPTIDGGPHASAVEIPNCATEESGPNPLELVGEVFGRRYRLDRHLASGGMGSVYVASHMQLGMSVAVKIMLPQTASAPGFVRRFEREARALSKISHRNIVRILDFGLESERPYIAMELLEGVPLTTWLESQVGLPTLETLDHLIGQTLDGLTAAHQAGIIHRDLKPDNMFVASESDGTQLVKLLDFGLAHYDDPVDSGAPLTRAGTIFGTPEYMSPEQCNSLAVHPSSDIYALGCILTELLQGSPPFEGETHMAVMTQQMYRAPPKLSRPPEAEPVPALLEVLRQDMLSKAPEQRPQDIAALRQRWSQAMNPARNASRFPGRKPEGDSGSRELRIPKWTAPPPSVSHSEPSIGEAIPVSLVQLETETTDVVNDADIAGFASAGIVLEPQSSEFTPKSLSELVLLQAGSVEGARAWLAKHNTNESPRALVSVNATAAQLVQLVESGAADVTDYPLDVPAAIRKLQRLWRRRGRRTAPRSKA